MALAFSTVYGQNTKVEKAKTVFSAKLYAVSTMEELGKSNSYFNNSVIIARSFSPTISWGQEYGNFQEVQLTDFGFGTQNNSFGMELGSRYSYNWRLFSKSETSKL